jgi:DHA3 family tetracycline resistance protein-like MFS transporter
LKKLSARSIYFIYSAAAALFFATITTLNLVYQATIVNLNPLQLVLVGTLLEATVFFCEIPTGVVADVYSRRLSVIIGVCLMGVGFLVEGSLPFFGTVLLSQVLWGVGYTFTSGAADAWIADEVGETSAGRIFLRGSQAALLGGIAGAVLSVALGSIRVNIPILVGGGLYLLLGLFLTLFMPEHGFTPMVREIGLEAAPPASEAWKNMAHTFRAGLKLVRGRPALLTVLLVGLFFGLYSEGFDRLWTPHLLRDIDLPGLGGLPPVVWFGAISIAVQLLCLGVTELARRTLNPDHPHLALRALFGASALLTAALVVFAFSRSFALALAALGVIGVSRRLIDPYYTTWVNRHLTSDVRATVLSMSSQVDAGGQIVGGPILGVIGASISISAALLGSAVLLSPALALFTREIQKERRVDTRESKIENRES